MRDDLKAILRKKSKSKLVSEVHHSKVSGGYIRLLWHVGLGETARTVGDCMSHVMKMHCAGSSAHTSYGLMRCREMRECVNEDLIETAWEMNDMELYLQLLFAHARVMKHVWYVDFTIGGDLQGRIPRDDPGGFARHCYGTMQEYFAAKLNGYDAEFGMDVVPQFWHSDQPGKGFHWHAHTIIPRVFIDRKTLKVLPIRMNQVADRNNGDLELLKTIWRRRVEGAYGLSKAKVKGRYGMFSVRVWFRGEEFAPRGYRKSLRHRLKYMYRGIVFDYEQYVERREKAGRPLEYEGWNKEFVRWSLLGGHKRHIGYGLMSSRGRRADSPFMSAIGFDYGTRKERRKEMRRRCPEQEAGGVCGCFIERWDGDEVVSLHEAERLGLKTVVRDYDEESLSDVQKKFQTDYGGVSPGAG
jgi:hypothetical protein